MTDLAISHFQAFENVMKTSYIIQTQACTTNGIETTSNTEFEAQEILYKSCFDKENIQFKMNIVVFVFS